MTSSPLGELPEVGPKGSNDDYFTVGEYAPKVPVSVISIEHQSLGLFCFGLEFPREREDSEKSGIHV